MDRHDKQQLKDVQSLYTDIIFAKEELDGFVEDSVLQQRTYIRCLPVLQEIIDLSKRIEEENSGGFFDRRGKTDEKKLTKELFEGKRTFEQLENCRKCNCFKCVQECKMEGCNRCEPGCGSSIQECDNKTVSVYGIKNKTIPLTENSTGKTKVYPVLSIILDQEYKQLYIVLDNNPDKLILYYYPNPSGDTYGEITDMEDMNFAIKAFEESLQ